MRRNVQPVRALALTGAGLILVFVLVISYPAHHAVATHSMEGDSPAATQETPVDPTQLFEYDNKVPLDVQVVGTETRGDVTIQDITFVGTTDPIKAYIVTPPGSGPFAGILYVHWLGDPETTNRTQFLDEAVSLATKGVVSVLIDALWAETGWYENRVPENDFDMSVRQVIELRRAMDLLASQPNIDTERIAFVGHDFGAMYGTLMGAVDQRPVTYVFMAGTPSFIDWYLYATQPQDLDAYKEQMAVLDPIAFVKLIHVPVFFQFAQTDNFIPTDKALAYYADANPPKQMATYDTDHGLGTPEVAADREAWLIKQLGLE